MADTAGVWAATQRKPAHWRNGLPRIQEFQSREMQSPAPEELQLRSLGKAAGCPCRKELGREGPGILGEK